MLLSRLGKPSRLNPGKKSMGVAARIKAPPAGMLTSCTHTHTETQM